MAHQQYNHQYPPPQNGQYPPPVQTQNLHQYQQQQQQRAPYSPPSSYQQSPTAMSPNMGGGVPPAKRQRLSPNPPSPSPYQSPFAASPYPQSQPQSPYATSPQYPMSMPASPAAHQPPPFHQPQPYQQVNAMNQHAASQGSMPPPKVPASKAQDDTLEKSNPRDLDVNNLSDVLSGGIVDLRAEEEMLLHSYSNRGQGASFNSQLSGSSAPPGGSFNWSQQGGHGAYQGSGPMSQTLTADQHEAELLRKHEQAARILNESSQHPLTDPFIAANVLRHRIAKRAYDTGISVNVDGLFDKIPEKNPRDVERRVRDGANGEQVVGLEAASLLNQNAPLVDIIALLTLAAEERVRTIIEDAYALSQGRQHTSHGIIPPQMVDIAVIEKDAESKGETPVNILKTPWESTEVVSSPIAVANKRTCISYVVYLFTNFHRTPKRSTTAHATQRGTSHSQANLPKCQSRGTHS